MSIKTPSELFNLTGKTALVTGSSRGLGKEFASALAAAGAQVMLNATQEKLLNEVETELKTQGFSVYSCAANLKDSSEIDKLVKVCQEKLGHVDILVANAGIELPGFIDSVSDETIQDSLQVNLVAPMQLTRALVPDMKKNKWGRLIYLSSISGFQGQGQTGHAVYSATKSALQGYLQTASMEVGPYGITANAIAPGVFLTDMAKDSLDEMGEVGQQFYNDYASMTALGRWGNTRDEIIGPVLLLASDAGGYITGSTLLVDGGARAAALPLPTTLIS